MSVGETKRRCYVAGLHSDYYLLLDEQAGQIFAQRLATRIREAHADGLPEIWIDHSDMRVWYVFDACLAA